MTDSYPIKAAPITNTLFGAFFLALDRLHQLPSGDGTGLGEGVATRGGGVRVATLDAGRLSLPMRATHNACS